jgi:hypothetical protein
MSQPRTRPASFSGATRKRHPLNITNPIIISWKTKLKKTPWRNSPRPSLPSSLASKPWKSTAATKKEKDEAMAEDGMPEDKKEDAMSKDMPIEEKMNAIADKAALAALKTYTAQFGALSSKVSHEAKREDKADKKFEAVVAAKAIELNSASPRLSAGPSLITPPSTRPIWAALQPGETITL